MWTTFLNSVVPMILLVVAIVIMRLHDKGDHE